MCAEANSWNLAEKSSDSYKVGSKLEDNLERKPLRIGKKMGIK